MLGWKPPIKVRWVGQDWEKHIKTVLVPKIKELWPESHAVEVRKNQSGVEAYWTEQRLRSTIEIMSNNQDSSLFEGWNGHLVVYDEPPKRDNRVACARGLIDYAGREIFAMTLLKEAWVHQEVINATLDNGQIDPTIFSIDGDINQNIGFGITQEGVDQFAKTLTREEKEARLKGVPAYLSGKILPIDRDKHIVDRFDIPSSWIVDVAIDIGVAKPHDILFLATSPRNFHYVCFEKQLRGDGEAIAEFIISHQQKYKYRLNRVICDPLAKSDKNNENTTWEKIDTVLMRYDHMLEAGSKSKEDGIIRLRELLSSDYGEPALYFFRDCTRSILQCDGWMYGDDGLPKKYRANELPGDDQAENIYRLALLETQWYEPQIQNYDQRMGKPDPYTGY